MNYVIVVGEDVDPTNMLEVMWAVCTRCKPDRDMSIDSRTTTSALWPALAPGDRILGIGSRVLLDATFPPEWPKEYMPKVCDWFDYPEEIREKVLSRWSSLGFKS